MRISEPTTMLTDYLLGAFTLTWAIQLLRQNSMDRQQPRVLWACGFAATALASFLGGTFHGFRLHLSAPAAAFLWRATLYSVGLASATMLAGALLASLPVRCRRAVFAVVGIKFLLFAVFVSMQPKFRTAMYDYALAMLIILIVQVHGWLARRDASAPWIIAGLMVGVMGSMIQQAGIGLHAQFNHNDLFHLVQIIGFYLLYRGGCLLRTIANPPSSGFAPG
jgi:hypothetical protein